MSNPWLSIFEFYHLEEDLKREIMETWHWILKIVDKEINTLEVAKLNRTLYGIRFIILGILIREILQVSSLLLYRRLDINVILFQPPSQPSTYIQAAFKLLNDFESSSSTLNVQKQKGILENVVNGMTARLALKQTLKL